MTAVLGPAQSTDDAVVDIAPSRCSITVATSASTPVSLNRAAIYFSAASCRQLALLQQRRRAMLAKNPGMPIFRTRLSQNHLVQVRWETACRGWALVASLVLSPAYSLQNNARGAKRFMGRAIPPTGSIRFITTATRACREDASVLCQTFKEAYIWETRNNGSVSTERRENTIAANLDL